MNIKFETKQKLLPFQLIRRDADFMRKPVTQLEHFFIISGRIEIVIDLRNVLGDIMMTNNANIPYPVGPRPDKYTSQIMKIVVEPVIKATDKIILGGKVATPAPTPSISPLPFSPTITNPYSVTPQNTNR